MISSSCGPCEACEDTLSRLNAKLTGVADNRLYNVRYELNRNVDYGAYLLYRFYKQILSDICSDTDCDCYGTDTDKAKIIERIKILTA